MKGAGGLRAVEFGAEAHGPGTFNSSYWEGQQGSYD